MIGFKSRVSFIQYCPLKPTKWGLKAFVLADSETGYISNILPYTGQETRAHLSSCNADLPLLAKVVVIVAEKIPWQMSPHLCSQKEHGETKKREN